MVFVFIIIAYEWCMTDQYDPQNLKHRDIKKKIELGNGIPHLDTITDVIETLHKLKCEIVKYQDLAPADAINPIPWYQPLVPSFSLTGNWNMLGECGKVLGWKTSNVGKWITHYLVTAMEKVGIAAPGSVQ